MTEKSISQAESWAVLACAMAVSMGAVIWSWHYGAMLNYGDAIAHLHIARRVIDSRTPRFSQLGSVWLPLPHILLLPFVQNYEWWATGLAGVIPSSLAYLAACAGIYRLARRWIGPAAAALALAFFALNPNLLYLQTTAMTEPLFLSETIWIVVWLVEWYASLDKETEQARLNRRPIPVPGQRPSTIRAALHPQRRGAWLPSAYEPPTSWFAFWKNAFSTRSSRLEICIAAALVAAIFTRYDGWIIAFIAWACMALALYNRRRLGSLTFWLASIAVVAAPLLWFTYNSVAFGDWLYFARGPYSAKAIEMRTAAPGSGPLHPGWHNLWVALLFYVKVSELDAAAAWGNVVLALAALGTAAAWFSKSLAKKFADDFPPGRRALACTLLLWLPVPFYTWSVAYGSVPIFFPNWWPHTFYNTRYGLELLPALALGLGFAAHFSVALLRRIPFSRAVQRFSGLARLQPHLPVLAFAFFFALAGLNVYALLRKGPLVYVESTKNLDARLPYDYAIPPVLDELLGMVPRAPVLMNTSVYPEIVSLTGIPLRQTVNESDLQIFQIALGAPAYYAGIVVAFDGDAIDRAVKQHPADLSAVARFSAKNQPSATIYISKSWFKNTAATF